LSFYLYQGTVKKINFFYNLIRQKVYKILLFWENILELRGTRFTFRPAQAREYWKKGTGTFLNQKVVSPPFHLGLPRFLRKLDKVIVFRNDRGMDSCFRRNDRGGRGKGGVK